MSFLRLIGKIDFTSRSVFVRCVVLLALSTGLVAISLGTMSLLTADRTAKRSLRNEAAQVTGLVAVQSGGGIMFNKGENVAADLESVIANANGAVLGGLALNLNDAEVAFAGAEETREALHTLARAAATSGETALSDDGFMVAAPVRFGKENAVVGALATAWTPAPLLAEIREEQTLAALVAFGLFVATLVATGWVTRRTVTRPLMAVDSAMARVASGDLSAEVPHTARHDEIGSIAATLSEFRDSLVAAERVSREVTFKGAGFEGSSAPMMLTDGELNVVYCNAAFRAVVGDVLRDIDPNFSADAVVGSRLGGFGELPAGFEAEIADVSRLPFKLEASLGESRIAIEINAVNDAGDTVIGYVVEWTDVTRLRRNSAILSALDANQVWIDISAEGQIIAVNENFCTLMAAEKDAARARRSEELIVVDGAEDEHARIEAVMNEGRSYFGRFRLELDGRQAIVEGSLTPILNGDGEIYRRVFIANDVTEQREALATAEADRKAAVEAQANAVQALGGALEQLSDGDMTATIDVQFAPEYERLREDFNRALVKLLAAMRAVVENSAAISGEVLGITQASTELSARTENQAATLEQTAAALDELTASVKSSAERAAQAAKVVDEARSSAEDSGTVVGEAVAAMGEIEQSSQKISKIIGVIDDIAFQTNLLALNAGVEAARAGDAGRGFAVVASEVRALAQRSSDAAREINGLISSSGAQVKRGVDLVGEAGKALDQIVSSVAGIAAHVSEIANSSGEQSQGLVEINQAMTQLDQVTQQNAAMFEETNAASQALARAAEDLSGTVARFRTGAIAPAPIPFPTAPKAKAKPARPAVATVNAAPRAPAVEDDSWAEF